MIALYIIIAILLVIMIVLILPISFSFSFKEEFSWKLSFLGIKILSSENKTESENYAKTTETPKTEKNNKTKNFFIDLKEKYGFDGAVKFCARLAQIIIDKLLFFIKRLRFKKFVLCLSVATDDAAKTAVSYGAICSAVYPVVAYLSSVAHFKIKKVDVLADFKSSNPDIKAALTVTATPIIAIITMITAFIEYRKLIKESELK